mgnify:CR=1 FL=1
MLPQSFVDLALVVEIELSKKVEFQKSSIGKLVVGCIFKASCGSILGIKGFATAATDCIAIRFQLAYIELKADDKFALR